MKAFISDIHGNLEALQAVLADIAQQHVEAIYCLGDVIGYGPNPRECLDLVMDFSVALLGNHDQAALFDPVNFSPAAERAILWTRSVLEAPTPSRAVCDRRWEFLGELSRSYRENGFLFVHASPRNPINEYIFPEEIYNPRKMEAIFALVDRCCFHGHTHVPGIFTGAMQFFSPDDLDHVYRLTDGKTLCNVGSVGQPRDGDRRACYVLFDGQTIRFRRVEYDVETTVEKIHAIDELDNFLGDRLRHGR
jgi:diadenosine tetraphosphatase ApaH/serine/threonine PP2A family protein phosphatase